MALSAPDSQPVYRLSRHGTKLIGESLTLPSPWSRNLRRALDSARATTVASRRSGRPFWPFGHTNERIRKRVVGPLGQDRECLHHLSASTLLAQTKVRGQW